MSFGHCRCRTSTHEKRSSLRTPTILIPPQLPIVTVCYDLASRWWHCIPCNSFVKELCKRQLWYVFLSFLCHHYGIPPHTHTHDKKLLYTISTNYIYFDYIILSWDLVSKLLQIFQICRPTSIDDYLHLYFLTSIAKVFFMFDVSTWKDGKLVSCRNQVQATHFFSQMLRRKV